MGLPGIHIMVIQSLPPPPISAAVLSDIIWWHTLLPRFNGARFFSLTARRRYHLFTDASNEGLGGFWFEQAGDAEDWPSYAASLPQAQSFASRHQQKNRSLHINVHEVRASQKSLQRWASLWFRGFLTIHTDSTTSDLIGLDPYWSSGWTEAGIGGGSIDFIRGVEWI